MKFTSGKWSAVGFLVEHADDEVADICSCDSASIGQEHLGRPYSEILANTRLIAAAPDMFRLLTHVAKTQSGYSILAAEAEELISLIDVD